MFSSRVEDEMEATESGRLPSLGGYRLMSDGRQLSVETSHSLGGRTANNRAKVGNVSGGSKELPANDKPKQKWILDPGSDLMLTWNWVFLAACLVGLFVDPLFFYLPVVDDAGTCIRLSHNLSIILTLLRTLADIFYALQIVIKFLTAYLAPSSRVFGRGELVMDLRKIARRYLQHEFILDLFAALPLPQIVIWTIKKASNASHSNNTLVLIIFLQYIPRLLFMLRLKSQIIDATGVITRTAWAGAGLNLCLYMLASHVLGALWYSLSIGRQSTCWKKECEGDPGCHKIYFDCDRLNDSSRRSWANLTTLFKNCSAASDSPGFNYGIYGNALSKKIVSAKFLTKYFYCLWWGLQQLSSYGQNLTTTTFLGDTLFAILIAIVGLVLFAHLIGNVQTYIQSLTVRLEEWRIKRSDTEEWMRHRQLPHDLRKRVRKYVQYKWFATQGVDEDSILQGLPPDLRRDIQHHLFLDLVRKVPFFSEMEGPLLDAICERLVSRLSTEGTYIVREGDPVTEMIFIIRGKLESSTTNGGRTGFINTTPLGPGDFCGEELLTWALMPKSPVNLPSSTQTVKVVVEVEAFALRADDLRFVANQFRKLHSKKFQQTFRFYSHQFRIWAVRFIEAAWHRYKRRQIAKDTSTQVSFASRYDEQEPEDPFMEEIHGSKETPSEQTISAEVLASKLSASTKRGSRNKMEILPKPQETDFSADYF